MKPQLIEEELGIPSFCSGHEALGTPATIRLEITVGSGVKLTPIRKLSYMRRMFKASPIYSLYRLSPKSQ